AAQSCGSAGERFEGGESRFARCRGPAMARRAVRGHGLELAGAENQTVRPPEPPWFCNCGCGAARGECCGFQPCPQIAGICRCSRSRAASKGRYALPRLHDTGGAKLVAYKPPGTSEILEPVDGHESRKPHPWATLKSRPNRGFLFLRN